MKTTIDCIPCYIGHALQVGRMVSDDPDVQMKIMRGALSRAAELDFDVSPPEMARELHARIRELAGVSDPYREVKEASTEFALEMLPFLRTEVEQSDDPFETIVRLVIGGNIIDFGANHEMKLDDVHRVLADALEQAIDNHSLQRLKHLMDDAGQILYLGDNCGEIVFDRLLIEAYRDKITFAVRGGPILNDATMHDAEISGLTSLVPVISTGDASPGVILKYCSDEFLAKFADADLIIAKGQGNYETLSETDRPIAFLLKAKCMVIARELNTESGSLQIILRNL